VITKEFDVLPKRITDLRFETDQAAYQNDHEIFLSGKSIDKMPPTSVGIKLMHETMMAMQSDRDASKVRLGAGALFAKNFNPLRVQDGLAEGGFGHYFTKEQQRLHLNAMKRDYLTYFSNHLNRISDYCDNKSENIISDARSLFSFSGRMDGGQYYTAWLQPLDPWTSRLPLTIFGKEALGDKFERDYRALACAQKPAAFGKKYAPPEKLLSRAQKSWERTFIGLWTRSCTHFARSLTETPLSSN
jgi:hypothetical protein